MWTRRQQLSRSSTRRRQSESSWRKRQLFRMRHSFVFAVFFFAFVALMIVTEVLVMTGDIKMSPSLELQSRQSVFGRVLKETNSDPEPVLNRSVSQQHVDNEQILLPGSTEQWQKITWDCFRGNSCPWQRVRGVPGKFFVYSAYWDDRTRSGRIVRVIGVAKTKRTDKVYCNLGYKAAAGNETVFTQVLAVVKPIRENWNLKYSAVFISCILSSRIVPDFVSISSTSTMNVTMPTYSGSLEDNFPSWYERIEKVTGNILAVRHHVDDVQQLHQLTVCVKPLHYEFDKVHQLIEFVEMHRILGVSHFTLYNHTVGPRVNCVLNRYIDEKLITVLPWHRLDIVSQKEIRTEGIFASLNDCLYRRMYDSEHLLFIDLDEFILPRMPVTLTDMLRSFHNRTTDAGAFYFRNAFFYLQWPDDPDAPGEPSLITLRKTRRNAKLHPHRIRSKYICRPKAVVEVGNHFVWEFKEGSVAYNVPDTAAVMHHYRTCEFGGNSCLKNPSVTDKTAFQYKDPLMALVQARTEQLSSVCNLNFE